MLFFGNGSLRSLARGRKWSCVTITIILTLQVVYHVTSYWYASSWMMGYNVAMNWVLAKWTSLPLQRVLDTDTHERFRGMVQLIDDEFFNHNDYSVFTSVRALLTRPAITWSTRWRRSPRGTTAPARRLLACCAAS